MWQEYLPIFQHKYNASEKKISHPHPLLDVKHAHQLFPGKGKANNGEGTGTWQRRTLRVVTLNEKMLQIYITESDKNN